MNEKPFLLTLSIVAVAALIYVVANKNVTNNSMEASVYGNREGTCGNLSTLDYVNEVGGIQNDCKTASGCSLVDFHGGECQGNPSCTGLNYNSCLNASSACAWKADVVHSACIKDPNKNNAFMTIPGNSPGYTKYLCDVWHIC